MSGGYDVDLEALHNAAEGIARTVGEVSGHDLSHVGGTDPGHDQMITADDARGRILLSGSDDWVSLAGAAYLVSTALPEGSDPPDVRRQTLAVIAELADEGVIEVGELAPRFVAWDDTTDVVLRRIEAGWTDAAQHLLPGDVCWFANTAAGDALAEELWLRWQEA